jgi:hypothetical protein
MRHVLWAALVVLASLTRYAESDDSSQASSPTEVSSSISRAAPPPRLRAVEVNFDELSAARNILLRRLADEPRASPSAPGWHRSYDHPQIEDWAERILRDPSGLRATSTEVFATWEHSSGHLAVQVEVQLSSGDTVATVLFAPPAV